MKKLYVLFAILLVLGSLFTVSGIAKAKDKAKDIAVVPTMNTQDSTPNRIWVGTFQIVWNEVMNNITKGPVEFLQGSNSTLENLNRQEFKKSDINENSYYTNFGKMTPNLKKAIEKGIKEKFDETSDILNSLEWKKHSENIIFYAMLKKDFKFLEAFDKLKEESFGTNPNNVKYFGIDNHSKAKLYKNVSVLFYNNENDFGVKLHTQGDDEVVLYRTDDDLTFDRYFEDLKRKSQDYDGNKYFGHYDRLKVPNINLYQIANFPEVEGKDIKDKDLRISSTIETIDFRMDNEGVKLKSEAAIVMMTTAMPVRRPQIRYFYCNDNFVLFLIEKDKTVPYYAMRVHDVETLNKTGRK